MKTSTQYEAIRNLCLWSGIAILSTSALHAGSNYDGIWQIEGDSYYSLTINGDQVLLVSFYDAVYYQDPVRGAYLGTLTTNDKTSPFPNAISSAYVKAERLPAGRPFYSWQIHFLSNNSAMIRRPQQDYPTTDFPPYTALRKIF